MKRLKRLPDDMSEEEVSTAAGHQSVVASQGVECEGVDKSSLPAPETANCPLPCLCSPRQSYPYCSSYCFLHTRPFTAHYTLASKSFLL